MKVLVYNDVGTTSGAPESLRRWLKEELPDYIKVEYTNAAKIKYLNCLKDEGVRAVFMPGGESRAFKSKLFGEGDYKIHEFVENGGAYYGFCAGGYYACKQVDFIGSGMGFSDINKTHYTAFFNGVAKGSIPELTDGHHYDSTFNSSSVVKLRYQENNEADIYYNGGCCFRGDFNNSSYKVLAVYDKLKEGENVAAVRCEVGKGYAVLAGVHPEVSYHEVFEKIKLGVIHKEKAEKVASSLEKNHSNNKNFHKFILKDLV